VYFRSLGACTAENRNVRARLVRPDGSSADSAAACEGLRRQELSSPGRWKVVVSADRDTTGSYHMELLPVRADRSRPIEVGAIGVGSIDQAGAHDLWTFRAAAGDRVRIFGVVPCGPNELQWQLRNPAGSMTTSGRVCDADPRPTTLPAAGQWTVKIFGTSDGTGAYRLRIERV
jgi:hypothetical protein